MLLESVADALLGGHPLRDASVDAAALLGGDGLGCEVVDAGVEAVLDETSESLVSRMTVLALTARLASPGKMAKYPSPSIYLGDTRGRSKGRIGTYAHKLLDLTLLHTLLQLARLGLC